MSCSNVSYFILVLIAVVATLHIYSTGIRGRAHNGCDKIR